MSWSTEHAVFYGIVFPPNAPAVNAQGDSVELFEIDPEAEARPDDDPITVALRDDARVHVGMHGNLMGSGYHNLHIPESWVAQRDPNSEGDTLLPEISPGWYYRIREACRVLGIVTSQPVGWHFVSITG